MITYDFKCVRAYYIEQRGMYAYTGDLRVGDNLGSPNRERAKGELKDLKPFGGVLGLQVGRVSRIDWKYPVPRS